MTISSRSLAESVELFDLDGKTKFSVTTLRDMLPDIETTLFFGKVYELKYDKLGELLALLHNSTVLDALRSGGHSEDLQDYIVDVVPTDVQDMAAPEFVQAPPPGDVLPELWHSLETLVADSIKQVAEALANTVSQMPSKKGKLVFQHMLKLNKQRPTIGTYQGAIHHERVTDNLVILDDSGSMSRPTIAAILGDVVSMAWEANATLALVSNTCRVFQPGAYDVSTVLAATEIGGTQYETLAPLLERDWDRVVTIADYDSSWSAKNALAKASGNISEVFDISLVQRPSFLAECVGQRAAKVTPMLVNGNRYGMLHA